MSLWIIIRPGGPHKIGEYFRDCGPLEVERIYPIKNERGRIVGENKSNIVLHSSSVHPFAVNLDNVGGMRNTKRQFQYDPATGKAYHVPDHKFLKDPEA